MLSISTSTMRLVAVLLVASACLISASDNFKPLYIGPGAEEDTTFASAERDLTLAEDDTISHRLPNNTRPLAYQIHLSTNVHTQTDFVFTGTVAIRLEALEATRSITINQRQLDIRSAQLTTVDGQRAIALAQPVYDRDTEQLTFQLGAGAPALVAGQQYILTVAYAGTLRSDEFGWYRSWYVSDAGETRWLATTHFEATDARHAFPCYDEPALRARFSIRLTHGRNYHALSNMPMIGAPVINGDHATTSFEETPVMPTYLIAFVVSDFVSIEAANSKGMLHRVFAPSNAIENGRFGLETSIKSLEAFEQYLGIPYELSKLDEVAVPQFPIGAMENWGLVLYHETLLLYNASRSTFFNKRRIASIIVHEHAHQWFGNLVTHKWWSYVWIKEGFATLYESFGTDWVFPEWRMIESFVPNTLQNVMIMDSTNRSRPMTHYVEPHMAVRTLFDSIAYPKSGSVLLMFMHAFTEESFRRALVIYLRRSSFGATGEVELFDAIEQQVKADGTLDAALDVPTIMSSWTRQAGYPLVTVRRDYRAGAATIVHLSQRRYFSEPQATFVPVTWWVPINVATARSADFGATAATSWLSEHMQQLTVAGLRPADWLLLNKRETGYYRVRYDERNYRLLSAALLANHSAIHLVSRAQLLDDTFELARSGALSYEVPLTLARFLRRETEYVPWASAWRALATIDRLQSGSAKFGEYQEFVRRLINRLFTEVGLSAPTGGAEEHHYRKQARIQAIQMACEYGERSCRWGTARLLAGFLNGTQAIHQDERATILCNGARSATDAQIQRLLELLRVERDQEERNRLIDALTCSERPQHLVDLLLLSAASGEQLWRSAVERYRVFVQVVGRRAGVLPAMDFLENNLESALEQYGMQRLNQAFDRVAEQVNSDVRRRKLDSLLAVALRSNAVAQATFERVAQTVRANEDWIRVNQKVIEKWVVRYA